MSKRPPLTLLALFAAQAALAQHPAGVPQTPPGETDPMQQPRYLEAEPSPGLALPAPPADLLPQRTPGPRFQLTGLELEGNTVFSDDELRAVLAPFIGGAVGNGELEEMRLALTRHYLEAGYVNSGAILPDQTIEGGVVRYRLIEGRLREIRISGAGRLREDYISGRLRGPEGEVLNTGSLQVRFQKLLTDPLIERLNGALRPGVEPGDGVLDLEVTRSRPYGLSVTADNHGAPSTGAERVRFDGHLYNLSGFGDRLALSLSRSEGDWGASGSLWVPLNARNTQFNLFYEESDASVIEASLKAIDIESEFRTLEVGLTHPLIDDLGRRLVLGASMAVRESQTWLLDMPFAFFAGVEDDGSARTSVVRLKQELTDRAVNRVLALRSTFNIGVDALDATIHEKGADGEFVTWVGQMQYARRFPESRSQVILRTDVQFADGPLLPLERFAVGGANSVRGYRENEYVRDNGYAASLEYRYPLLGNPFSEADSSLQLAGFLDLGGAWDDGEWDQRNDLYSVGAGLIWNARPWSAELYFAHPLEEPVDKPDYDLQDDGIHFRLNLELL